MQQFNEFTKSIHYSESVIFSDCEEDSLITAFKKYYAEEYDRTKLML